MLWDILVNTVLLQSRIPISRLRPSARKFSRMLASPHLTRRIQVALGISPVSSLHDGGKSGRYVHSAQIRRNTLPIIISWPRELKEDLEEACRILYDKQWKDAIPLLKRAWLRIQSILMRKLCAEPKDTQALCLGLLISANLQNNGYFIEAYRFLGNAVNAFFRRLEEDMIRRGVGVDKKFSIRASKEEREAVIRACLNLGAMALSLGPEYERDVNRWIAHAYIESVCLSRANYLESGEPLFTETLSSVTPRQLEDIFGDNAPDSTMTLFDIAQQCRTSFVLKYWIVQPLHEPKLSSLAVMVVTTEQTAELASKRGRDHISLKLLSDAVVLINEEHKNTKPADKPIFQQVEDKFFREAASLLDTFPRVQTLSTRIALSKWSERAKKDKDNIEPDPITSLQFHILNGRLLLFMNDPIQAAQKFKRGLEMARINGCTEEQKIAAAGLEMAQQCLANDEQPRFLVWQSLKQVKDIQNRFGYRLLGMYPPEKYLEGSRGISAS